MRVFSPSCIFTLIGYLLNVLIILFAFSKPIVNRLPFSEVYDWFSLFITLTLMLIIAAVIFVAHHISVYYFFPKLKIDGNGGDVIMLKELRGNRTVQEFPREIITKIQLIYQATSFYIVIHVRDKSEEKHYKYEVADGYVQALFFKRNVGEKHKRNMKDIFKGIRLYEYKKGGTFRRF